MPASPPSDAVSASSSPFGRLLGDDRRSGRLCVRGLARLEIPPAGAGPRHVAGRHADCGRPRRLSCALIRPLLVRTDNLSLALRVEEAYPNLNDSLASAVQFLEQSKRGGPGQSASLESSILRLEAVRRTMRLLDGIDFRRAVSARGVGPAGLMATCRPSLSSRCSSWPTPRSRSRRVQRLALAVRGQGLAPEDADRRGRLQGPCRSRRGVCHPLPAGRAHSGLGLRRLRRYHAFPPIAGSAKRAGGPELNLRLDRVERSFRFKVEANDAITKWYDVTVLPPPVLVPLNGRASPQVSLRYPAYTDLLPREAPRRQRQHRGRVRHAREPARRRRSSRGQGVDRISTRPAAREPRRDGRLHRCPRYRQRHHPRRRRPARARANPRYYRSDGTPSERGLRPLRSRHVRAALRGRHRPRQCPALRTAHDARPGSRGGDRAAFARPRQPQPAARRRDHPARRGAGHAVRRGAPPTCNIA